MGKKKSGQGYLSWDSAFVKTRRELKQVSESLLREMTENAELHKQIEILKKENDQLKKEQVLGVRFVDQQTQQFAIQTENEIWIDKNLFEKMNLEDQARLFLHEFFMTWYTSKFLKQTDLCKKKHPIQKGYL